VVLRGLHDLCLPPWPRVLITFLFQIIICLIFYLIFDCLSYLNILYI
jgi:Mn2+/Fe2+ NRAMP family transporter